MGSMHGLYLYLAIIVSQIIYKDLEGIDVGDCEFSRSYNTT